MDVLLQPFQLKHLRLKNRIMISAHEPAYAEDGMPKQRYLAYQLERVKAGVALTMTAGSATVSRDSAPLFNNILAYKDEVVQWLKRLTDACHEHGAAVMIQLTHLGRRTMWSNGDWLPVVAPSHLRESAHRAFPKKLEDWDIQRIIQDYADAAERMQAAGMDGIELECYGHLMDQFWSPLTNTLDEPWNGSLENRLRFSIEVLTAIRKRVGAAFIVGVRGVVDERLEGGIPKEEGIAIAQYLKQSGMVDFYNVIRGHIDTDAGLADVIPVQGMPSNPHLDFAGEVKNAVGLPVFHASKIQDVNTARYAIESNKLDLVGMTRAHIADPHIVKKIIAKRESMIRPCVGATYCLDRIYQGGEALCIHNAATGRELNIAHTLSKTSHPRKVLIVGAGPAGLEAARVASERGHQVIVFEAQNQAGGQVRLCALAKRRREMLSIIDWRMARCEEAGVQFHFNTWVDKTTVLEAQADVVVIATGGIADTDILQSGAEWVTSTWDMISGAVKPKQHVLLFDDAGDHAALQAAQTIVEAGGKLTYATPERSPSVEVMSLNYVPYIRQLQRFDIEYLLNLRLHTVARDRQKLHAHFISDYTDVQKCLSYDQVVVNHGTLPIDDLYFDLKPASINQGAVDYQAFIQIKPQPLLTELDQQQGFLLYRIGDAVSARNIHAAVYDALRLMSAV